jgi:hypothetical protein
LGFWPGLFGEWSGQKRPSRWYATDVQIAERYLEAATGSSVGIVLGLLVWAGLARVILRGPDDPEERQKFIASGGRQYTVQFGSGDKALSVGYTVGLLAPFRLPIMAIGIMQELFDAEARQAERIDEAGESVGEPREAFDVISARGAAVAGNLIVAAGAGRTSLGLASQFVDPYTGDLKGASVIRQVGNLIPYVPGLRQVGRMANSMTDERLRTYRIEPHEIVQLLMPQWMPIPFVASGEAKQAPMMNLFGEPWTPGGMRQVADVLTGNLIGLAEKSPSDKAWAVLAKAKYYPTPQRIGRAVLWPDGKLAPMREADYLAFRRAYGQKLRAHLETVDLDQPREDLVGLIKGMDADAELEALVSLNYGPKPKLRR